MMAGVVAFFETRICARAAGAPQSGLIKMLASTSAQRLPGMASLPTVADTLPDFFVAGVPKAGTTALHAALARHPALYMSAVKEPKFFLTDGPPPADGGPGDIKTYR